MANIQIPNLPAVVNLSGAELLEAVQSGSSVKVSLAQIAALFQIGTPLTFPLQVAIGGTGTTTSTGTGSVVLSNNPVLVNPSFSIGSFGLGTVSAPSITFTGDLNTGIWSPGADTMAVSTNGLERMRINAAGTVVIGNGETSATPANGVIQATNGVGTDIVGANLNIWAGRGTGTGAGGVLAFATAAASGTSGTALNPVAERMRIDTTGNVGIGTLTPASRLNVVGDQLVVSGGTGLAGFGIQIKGSTISAIPAAQAQGYIATGDSTIGTAGDLLIAPRTSAAANIRFITGTTPAERMRLDSAGNLGLGVTPSAWNASYDAFQIGPRAAASSEGTVLDVTLNSFANVSAIDTYIVTATATKYRQQGGAHQWLSAPSGTAGNPITFTQAMTLHTSGGLSVGNTTDPGATNLSVTGIGSFGLGTAGAPSHTFTGDLNTGMWSPAADTVAFSTAGSERMRIDSVGNVGIGVTPSPWLNSATSKALDFSRGGVASLAGGPVDHIAVFANAYVTAGTDPATATWNYKLTGSATLYEGGRNGTHRWFTAPSGTAGAAITFTERLNIGLAGQIGIGGANYGTSGQTIISAGAASPPAWGTLGLAGGGTGVTTAPAAAAVLLGYTATATAAGTTVLTNTSTQYQLFTGTLTQTITLPVTSTLTTGWSFHIVNASTGNLTVNSSGGNLVATVIPGTTVMVTCILTSGTTAASWEFGYTDFNTLTGTGSVVMSDGATAAFALGAVGTPSITFTGDLNTGIWSPAADTVAFSTNGAERMRITSAGDITQANATSGAGAIVGEQTFRLAADGTAFGAAIGDFFGANSAISLEASSVYEVTIYAVFTKTTAGTATWTLTASSAPTRMVGSYQASPVTGIAAGADTSSFTGSQGATTAAFAATGSLTTAVNHAYQFRVQVQTNAATNFRLQLTQSAGTATPLAGSYYTVKKISATTGTFVA